MNQEIEIEFKNMLTDTEFNKMKEHFLISDNQFFMQENEYFDTTNFDLKSKLSALRIRKKGDQYVLTLKQPAQTGLLETHQTLSVDEVKDFKTNQILKPGDVYSVLKESGIDISDLHSLGTLKTKRAELSYKEGLLVLDHSFYLDTEDFEMEYEVNEAITGKKLFGALLKELNIPVRPTKNKIVRFYERKKLLG